MPTAPGGHAAVKPPGAPEIASKEPGVPVEPHPPHAGSAANFDPITHSAVTARPLPLGASGPSASKPRSTLAYGNTRSNVEDSEAHVEAALEASSRAEASLSALLKTIHQVTTGVSGAREANDALVTELQSMREMLRTSNERRSALERRIALVEQERDAARRSLEELEVSAAADRTFLMEEQDRFLQAVMEEHEQTVNELVRERDEAGERAARVTSGLLGIQERHSAQTNPNLVAPSEDTQKLGHALADARRTIERLVAERDRARDVLRRLQSQRDEAQDAVDRLTAEVEETRDALARNLEERASLAAGLERANPDGKRTDPVPAIMDRPTFPAPPQQVDAAVAASRANTPPMPLIVPQADAVPRAPTPPPEELRGALFSSDPPRDEDWDAPAGAARASISQPPPSTEEARATPLPKLPEDDGPQITIKRPPLKPKPDPASHSLGGYSMAGEGIESDRIDTAKIRASKPPVK